MNSAKYDVLGIGNALFDILVRVDDKFLTDHGMTKGSMALIDEARAASIYSDMGPATEVSGGSAANTIVGVAQLGARAAYVGKIKDDQIGQLYAHDIRAAGVAFGTAAAKEGPAVRRRNCRRLILLRMRSPRRRSSILKAICGTRRTPRMLSSRRRRSRTSMAARSR